MEPTDQDPNQDQTPKRELPFAFQKIYFVFPSWFFEGNLSLITGHMVLFLPENGQSMDKVSCLRMVNLALYHNPWSPRRDRKLQLLALRSCLIDKEIHRRHSLKVSLKNMGHTNRDMAMGSRWHNPQGQKNERARKGGAPCLRRDCGAWWQLGRKGHEH